MTSCPTSVGRDQLAGPPRSAGAVTVRQGSWNLDPPSPDAALPEDAGMAVVRYPGDVLCQIDIGWSTPFARNSLEANGTAGSLVATDIMRTDPVAASR